MTNIQKLKYKSELLELLERTLNSESENLTRSYEPTGEKYQAKDWKTGELLWEDEDCTIPLMYDKYDYVAIPLDADAVAKLEVIESLRKGLEQLLAK